MTVPGVNVICAATFMAAVGEIGRFRKRSGQLVGYLGLDPRVYQSGSAPATSGHISKQGSASTRWALVEAAWSAVRQPGPQHAFYQRVRARRGHGIAIVASARKLACLFWFLLTRGEDYAHQQPSLTAKKLRLLEVAPAPARLRAHRPACGPPGRRCARASAGSPSRPRPPTSKWSATGRPPHRREGGRERDTGARITKAHKGQGRAADHEPLTSALRLVLYSRPQTAYPPPGSSTRRRPARRGPRLSKKRLKSCRPPAPGRKRRQRRPSAALAR